MATTKNINELETISANSAKILAMSPDGSVGYVSGVFNESGNLDEVANLDYVSTATYTEKVTEIEDTAANLKTTISALETARDTIQQSITEHTTSISKQDGEIEALQASIEQLDKLNAIADQLKELPTTVNKLAEQIGEVNANDILTLTNAVNGKADIDTLKNYATLAGLTELQSTVEGKADANTVTTLSNDVATLKSASATHITEETLAGKSYLTAESETITGLTEQVTSLQSLIEGLQAKIEELEKKGEELEQSNAEAIAAVNNYTAVVKDMIAEEK